jgi:hypothetical protein
VAQTVLEADYVVVGAGAMGMAFTDALVEHADASVVLVERRHSVSGHWLNAYPFVRLHQSSSTYGVASMLLGGNQIQESGPEAGWDERATAAEICTYYARVLQERLLASGRVSFYPNCDYVGDGRFVSHVSGEQFLVEGRRRVVNAHYLSPMIPATTPPPFGVAEGARVLPVNDLVDLDEAPSQYVVAGSGKTATDACIWLLENGVDPDAIEWVRPRDPWMINRAAVQPDPLLFLNTEAEIMEAADAASSPDDLFLRMEEAGVMVRIDRSVTPTMAKIATLAHWEIDALRTIDRVVRLGHIVQVKPGRLMLADGDVPSPGTRWSCTASPGVCGTRHWCRSGSRRPSRCSRYATRMPASGRRSPVTWRRPSRTTTRRTGCAPRCRSPTPRLTGRTSRSWVPGRPSRRSPTSTSGSTPCPSTRPASRPSWSALRP